MHWALVASGCWLHPGQFTASVSQDGPGMSGETMVFRILVANKNLFHGLDVEKTLK